MVSFNGRLACTNPANHAQLMYVWRESYIQTSTHTFLLRNEHFGTPIHQTSPPRNITTHQQLPTRETQACAHVPYIQTHNVGPAEPVQDATPRKQVEHADATSALCAGHPRLAG